jgi:hypothetical protein
MKKLLFLLIIISTICSGQIINKSSPQAQGLILNYPLKEQGGPIAIDGMGMNNATLTNGAYFKNKACVFDGSNDYVIANANVPMLAYSNVLTVSFWFNFTSHVSFGTILGKYVISSNNSAAWDFGVLFNGTNNYLSLVRNQIARNTTYTLPTNTWVHITCEIGENRAVLYVNGVQVQTTLGIGTGNTTNTAGRTICMNNTSLPVNCSISEYRLYNRALTPTEVMDLYINPNKILR